MNIENMEQRAYAKTRTKGKGPKKLVIDIYERDKNWKDMKALWRMIKNLTEVDYLGYHAWFSADGNVISIYVSLDDDKERDEEPHIVHKLNWINVRWFKVEIKDNY